MASESPVLIVGGGIAGLACARELAIQQIPSVILEASDGIGGRVRTDEVDGFKLDRGFQVYFTDSDEGSRFLDLAALNLRPFTRGVLVRYGGGFHRLNDPRSKLFGALASLWNPIGTPRDKYRLALLYRRLMKQTGPSPEADRATRDYLSTAGGFTDSMIDRFFRPLLGSVFLEQDLHTSCKFFESIVRQFSAGESVLPSAGIEAIPRLLAARLSTESIRLHSPVSRVTASMVQLTSGEWLQGRAVVVSADARTSATLLGDDPNEMNWHGSTTLYYAARHAPIDEPTLVLDGENHGPINSLVELSSVSPEFAPPGWVLISANVIGVPSEDDETLDTRARHQLTSWFGNAVLTWKLLRVYRIPFMVPAMLPGAIKPKAGEDPAHTFFCGDYCNDSSIDAALASGRQAATAIARRRVAASWLGGLS